MQVLFIESEYKKYKKRFASIKNNILENSGWA